MTSMHERVAALVFLLALAVPGPDGVGDPGRHDQPERGGGRRPDQVVHSSDRRVGIAGGASR